MRTTVEHFFPHYGKVRTMHVLDSGEIIDSLEKFRQVSDRFSWVDRVMMISKILELRKHTDEDRLSVLVLYEQGQQIRSFLNVEEHFNPPVL